MNIDTVINQLRDNAKTGFDVYERRPGTYQLILPILHEDGDMVDVYFQDSPDNKEYVRICDFGMTMMRLSYTYQISSSSRQRIFESILTNSGVNVNEGNIYLDTNIKMLFESILQFAGCVQKVCSMRYWNKEIIRSTFYEDLEKYTTTRLACFHPKPEVSPISSYDIISVDWSLTHNDRNFYMFGVHNNDKAKVTAIALLEFQRAILPFISLVVHEDMENLGRKERLYLTKNADAQYPQLGDFREKAEADITRLAT